MTFYVKYDIIKKYYYIIIFTKGKNMTKNVARKFSRKKIWEIATQYANTKLEYSREFFSQEYCISYNTFYTLLEKAVIEGIVDDETVKKMSEKAGENSARKAGEGARKRSENHYNYLILKRKIYMLPKEETHNIVIKYSNSELSKKKFCEDNFITTKLFDRMMCKAIIENWVSDDTVEKLKNKSVENNNNEKTVKFWEQLLRFRSESKKNQG